MVQMLPGFTHQPDSEDVPAFPALTGGIRIEVGGTVLTERVDDGADERPGRVPSYDSTGTEHAYPIKEFAGEDIGLSLDAIYRAFEPFVTGTTERHTEYIAEFSGEPGSVMLAFSVLDGDSVRVATLPRTLDGQVRLTPAAMTGCAVDLERFADALADCFEECIAYTKRAYVETERWTDFTDAFAELRVEYDEYVRTLRSTDKERRE